MKKTAIIPVCLALILAGCFTKNEITRYYAIALDLPKARTAYECDAALKKITIDPAYDRLQIVYRESPYDFMFYNYDLWAGRPNQLVQKAVKEFFKSANLFKNLSDNPTEKPDFEILSHIDAVEEVDEGQTRYAHLAIAFAFKRVDQDGTLWQEYFDQTRRLEKNEPREIAREVSHILQEALAKTYKSIDSVLATIPPGELVIVPGASDEGGEPETTVEAPAVEEAGE